MATKTYCDRCHDEVKPETLIDVTFTTRRQSGPAYIAIPPLGLEVCMTCATRMQVDALAFVAQNTPAQNMPMPAVRR